MSDGDGVEERRHFMHVCYSIAGYSDVAWEILDTFARRQSLVLQDPLAKKLWDRSILVERLKQMRQRIMQNQQVLMDAMVWDLAENMVGPPAGLGDSEPPPGQLIIPDGHEISQHNSSKAVSTIKQFVRDWSQEGAAEREKCYGPLTKALQKYVPLDPNRQRLPKVVTPGSGLGRLTFDVARLGYHAEGNEFSYHMLLGTMWVLNDCDEPLSTTIYPFVLDTNGRQGALDHLRGVQIPDVCPSDFCDPASGFGNISMRGGEFCEVYKDCSGDIDALLSAFFIDTANNIFHYIRCFADTVRPGGLWANVGPLLWHYSKEGGGEEQSVSIELAWEEVKPAIEKYFDIREEDRVDCLYTDRGSKRKLYHCVYFAAIRNDVPVGGVSSPVH